mgnify:CR=1 FL=1
MVGGLGMCGMECCCSRFKSHFDVISINMAKNQLLALNIDKLSGMCGKLKCCLKYEDDDYKQIFDEDEILQLYKYIHNLEKDVREIFYLRLKGNLSFRDIAEITGKSEEWARVNFYRGKLKIKESLLKDEKRV